MGCQTSVLLENNLTFSICTHDADTGALTDASAAPTYRIYEDETGTPILTGTMAKLDDAGTLGFYTELIACTTANGFEAGKSYTIYIEATVDGITGGIAYAFTVAPALIAANVAAVNAVTTHVDKLAAHLPSVLILVVDAASDTTHVVFKTVNGGAASVTDDFYNGAVIVFTSGALAGQRTSISDYVGLTKTATVVALTGAPAEDVTAVIV